MSESDLHAKLREFYDLLESSPHQAAALARRLPEFTLPNGCPSSSLRAALLIDFAEATHDAAAVNEALSILETLHTELPDEAEITYNLANALSIEARLEPPEGASTFLRTASVRLRARAKFVEAAKSKDPELLGRIHTNLGNELWRAYRWVEAYDAYMDALDIDPTNAVARCGAVKVLLQTRARGIGDPDVTEAVAARHAQKLAGARDRIRALAGEVGARDLDRLLSLKLSPEYALDLSAATPYERFVADHRLALAATIEGLDIEMRRWDSLVIASVIESSDAASGVPPVFSVFDVAKSEYLAARWLCYLSLGDEVPETGSYHDSLDYAVYGTRPALLILAQRASHDVLDKVALLITEYLRINESPRSIAFRSRWHAHRKRPNDPLRWHPALAPEIELGNQALIALADVAVDLGPLGALSRRRDARDAGTHRALVMHDLSMDQVRKSHYVEHVRAEDYQRLVIDTLRLARASLIYAVEAIAIREARECSKFKFLAPLNVPLHHWVRGDDE